MEKKSLWKKIVAALIAAAVVGLIAVAVIIIINGNKSSDALLGSDKVISKKFSPSDSGEYALNRTKSIYISKARTADDIGELEDAAMKLARTAVHRTFRETDGAQVSYWTIGKTESLETSIEDGYSLIKFTVYSSSKTRAFAVTKTEPLYLFLDSVTTDNFDSDKILDDALAAYKNSDDIHYESKTVDASGKDYVSVEADKYFEKNDSTDGLFVEQGVYIEVTLGLHRG